jgi:hypothetical protein
MFGGIAKEDTGSREQG